MLHKHNRKWLSLWSVIIFTVSNPGLSLYDSPRMKKCVSPEAHFLSSLHNCHRPWFCKPSSVPSDQTRLSFYHDVGTEQVNSWRLLCSLSLSPLHKYVLMQPWIYCICLPVLYFPVVTIKSAALSVLCNTLHPPCTHTHTTHLQPLSSGKKQSGARNAYHYLTITLSDGTAFLFMDFLIYFSQAAKCWSPLKISICGSTESGFIISVGRQCDSDCLCILGCVSVCLCVQVLVCAKEHKPHNLCL